MDDSNRDLEGAAQEFSQQVADRVMEAVIASGLSVRQVAAGSGINRTTLQDRINNVRPFNTDELARVAAVLGIDPGSFVRD